MEPLPRGANFKRSKTLWEIGLQIAGNPDTPYTGDRDMCIVIGSGSGESFKPGLRMATGSPILAHDVVAGDIEMAFVNPSGALTQAYRGTGLFTEPLPVRVVMSYPSWDRFVVLFHERTGLRSLAEVREKRYPLRMSMREDPTHSTRVLTDQLLPLYGFTLADLESWGGSFQLVGPPGDPRRVQGIRDGQVDAVLDEGIASWFDDALAHSMRPITLEDDIFRQTGEMGWRRVVIPAGRFPHLREDYVCIDYSGWPLYTRASLPDATAYEVCAAVNARAEWIPWEDSYTGVAQVGQDTEATPIDVPLHPGAERWYREQGFIV